ncbi:SGNH/GDSL hydrolase family protein, partial [bacterium]|nr:SGNH/GDSL hydrolase family protein [bacterium]
EYLEKIMTNNVVSIKNCILLASLTIFSSCASVRQANQSDIKMNEGIEWCNTWHNAANKDNLPRVLFIGDSMTNGYFNKASKYLKGKAHTSLLCTSSSLGSNDLTQQIKLVLNQHEDSVIHFNNGLHGRVYSNDQYRKAFEETIKLLKKESDAVIIWRNITPYNPESKNYETDNGWVDERNAIANEIVAHYQIPTQDLYTPMKGKADYYRDPVHFKPEAIKIQAQQVADTVLKYLK